MASKSASILFKFNWKQFVPDCRAYKPSAPVIETNYQLGVDVPLKHEFLWNSTEIIQAQLSASEVPEPILTPLGMRFCIDQVEQVMVNPDIANDGETDTSDWDEGEDEKPTAPATKKSTPKVDEEEDWEEAPAGETTTKTDEDWDENWEV